MPRKPQVNTLKTACLKNIARHMDGYWCKDFLQNFSEGPGCLYVIGPFEYLTPALTEVLLETLSRLNLLRKHHLQLLLHPKLKKINLSILRPLSNQNGIAKMIYQQCTSVTHLNLAHCKQVSAQVICEILSRSKSLTHLDLSGTKSTDQVCAIVALHCPEIQELRLKNCPVTNSGMASLCLSFPGDPPAKCPRMVKLDISDTKVGLKGVTHALCNLPQLQWLDHPLTCLAIAQLHPSNDSDGRIYGLRNLNLNLHMMAGHLDPQAAQSLELCIAAACVRCPCATHVTLVCPLNGVVWPLATLSSLRSLELVEDSFVEFELTVLPVLQAAGGGLVILHLTEVGLVDLAAIGYTCPNLRHLTLAFNQHSATFAEGILPPEARRALPAEHRERPFAKLEELHLSFFSNSTLSSSSLSWLLTQCKSLKSLTLVGVQSLNDHVVDDVLKATPFKHLEKLCLMECNSITGDALLPLLNMDNQLFCIKLLNCKEIMRSHFDVFQNIVSQKGYETSIYWE